MDYKAKLQKSMIILLNHINVIIYQYILVQNPFLERAYTAGGSGWRNGLCLYKQMRFIWFRIDIIKVRFGMALNYQQKRRDFVLLFVTRILRMFSYGMLSLIFFDNLFYKGLTPNEASWIQSGIVFGDVIISLVLTTQADKIGRVNTLMIGAFLKLLTGLFYAEADNVIILTVSGILGVISVTGGEIGPFMPIEQSALAQLVEDCSDSKDEIPKHTSAVFGYYNMAGYLSQALGAVFAGFFIAQSVDSFNYTKQAATANIVRLYAIFGGLKFIGYYYMNRDEIEPHIIKDKSIVSCTGIRKENMGTIASLSSLFALDAFAGAFIVQSFLSYYYEMKYDLFFDDIGGVLFACNVVSGISGVLSSKLVDRIGAMATMIYTHLPSNVFLLFIAFTSSPTVSILLLFGRFCISQMDVPARQTYVTMVVSSEERSAANGITNIARSVGLVFGLGLNGYFMNQPVTSPEFSYPFVIAGGLKIVYDITIGCLFLWNQRTKKNADSVRLESTELVETPALKVEVDDYRK